MTTDLDTALQNARATLADLQPLLMDLCHARELVARLECDADSYGAWWVGEREKEVREALWGMQG